MKAYGRLAAMCAVLLALAIGCGGARRVAQRMARRIEKAAEWHRVIGGPAGRFHGAARSAAEFDRLKKRIGWGVPAKADFSRQMVVAVCLGIRRTGGFAVRFISAKEEGGRFLVRYEEMRPAPGSYVIQSLTAPCALKAVPKSDRKVLFELRISGERGPGAPRRFEPSR